MEYDDIIDHTMNNVEAGGGNTLSITLDHLQDPISIGIQVYSQLYCNVAAISTLRHEV